jgi:hypothetical protein
MPCPLAWLGVSRCCSVQKCPERKARPRVMARSVSLCREMCGFGWGLGEPFPSDPLRKSQLKCHCCCSCPLPPLLLVSPPPFPIPMQTIEVAAAAPAAIAAFHTEPSPLPLLPQLPARHARAQDGDGDGPGLRDPGGGLRLDQRQGHQAGVGQDDAQHHRHHAARPRGSRGGVRWPCCGSGLLKCLLGLAFPGLQSLLKCLLGGPLRWLCMYTPICSAARANVGHHPTRGRYS